MISRSFDGTLAKQKPVWLLVGITVALLVPVPAIASSDQARGDSRVGSGLRNLVGRLHRASWATAAAEEGRVEESPALASSQVPRDGSGLRSKVEVIEVGTALSSDVDLRLIPTAAGPLGMTRAIGAAVSEVRGNSTEYDWGSLRAIVNVMPSGLEITFTVSGDDSEPCEVLFEVSTDLSVMAGSGGHRVDFYRNGDRIYTLRVLRAGLVEGGAEMRLSNAGRLLRVTIGEGDRLPVLRPARPELLNLAPTAAKSVGPSVSLLLSEGDASVEPGLGTTPVWYALSGQEDAELGRSVSTAGDVNGDGFSDVVVGAPLYDGPFEDSGRAMVFFGTAAGPRQEPAWTLDGGVPEAQLGAAVATAGDVNGDGYSDVLVGAPGVGQVRVFLGSPAGLSSSGGWTVTSEQSGSLFGSSVSTAGDVNGDGYADVLVGAPGFDGIGEDEGRAYLFLGSATGLSASPAWSASGEMGAEFGASVAAAGDVNGDGYDDVIVGSPGYFYSEGAAFVYYGSSAGLGTSPDWWTSPPDYSGGRFGEAVASAGDVNGDGYSDIIIGAPWSNVFLGKAFVVLGSADGLETTPAQEYEGTHIGEYFGNSVGTAGDVNGDGFADVIVGAYGYNSVGGVQASGALFLFLGSPSGSKPDPFRLVAIAEDLNGKFGASVSTAGDVNGDGYSDVIVGAPWYWTDQPSEGGVFLFLGAPLRPAFRPGWQQGGFESEPSVGGTVVAAAGDVNGDGYADVIIGDPDFDGDFEDEGRALLYLGAADGLHEEPAWIVSGGGPYLYYGWSVAAAGDVDGDGYADVVIGAIQHGQDAGGAAFVYLGGADGLDTSYSWGVTELEYLAYLGWSVASAGDVNGDGYGDVIIGVPGRDTGSENAGGAYVFYGSPHGLSDPEKHNWFAADSKQTGAFFGSTVTSAGDVNGDGFSDVVVGAINAGGVYTYLGSPTGLSDSPTWQLEIPLRLSVAPAGDINGDGNDDILIGVPDVNTVFPCYGSAAGITSLDVDHGINIDLPLLAQFGASLSALGDLNADGYDDVLVGAPYDQYRHQFEGWSYVFLGSRAGFGDILWLSGGSQAFALYGSSVAGLGDVNGDGFGDFLVSAPGYSDPEKGQGHVFLYHGNADFGKFYGHEDMGLPRLPAQLRVDANRPIGQFGLSDSEHAFRIAAIGRTALGRGGVRLEWEIKLRSAPFDGSGVTAAAAFQETGPPSPAGSILELQETAESLQPGNFYRWRARIASDSPLLPSTPWLGTSFVRSSAQMFRTPGPLPPQTFRPTAPPPNKQVFPDSEPPIHVWNRGEGDTFELQWSSSLSFKGRVVSSGPLSASAPGYQTFTPDAPLWKRILRLARNPDFREIPVFWRVVPDGASRGELEVRSLRVAAAGDPEITSPEDGAEVAADSPPTITWWSNHNERFKIRFSPRSSLGKPRLDSGGDFQIRDSIHVQEEGFAEWTPTDVWSDVVRMAAQNEGIVYYCIFAKDSLGRMNWSRVRSLRVGSADSASSSDGLPDEADTPASKRQD